MHQPLISIEEVKTKITSAFSNVQFPGDQFLLRLDSQDESEIEDFIDKNWRRWQNIPQEIIDYNNSSLCFLSPLALRFFLPAYLMYGLDYPDSNTLVFTIYKLIPPDDPKLREFFSSWVNQLTEEEKAAIALFLRYIKEQYDQMQFTPNDAEEALQGYWNNCEISNY
jgi:GH15 family glucan-1,4-alpha-glucosidase